MDHSTWANLECVVKKVLGRLGCGSAEAGCFGGGGQISLLSYFGGGRGAAFERSPLKLVLGSNKTKPSNTRLRVSA